MESPPLPADPLQSALAGLVQFAEEQQKRDPEGSDWGVVAGYGWLRSRDYAKAIAALSRVTQRSPEDVSAWNLLGEAQRQAGQPGRAAQTLERASIIGRTSYLTFFLLGEAYRDASRLDRAVGAYREAVRLEPLFRGSASARTPKLHWRYCRSWTASSPTGSRSGSEGFDNVWIIVAYVYYVKLPTSTGNTSSYF